MIDVVGWLGSAPGHRVVPLFDCETELVVRTHLCGKSARRILKRSTSMEAAVVEMVELGVADPEWEGLLYVMGWGVFPDFVPLYVGKAERKGVSREVSANIERIRSNKHMFARWGDGVAYHIGDLSHAMFRWDAYQRPTKKYERWAAVLFQTTDPPRLVRPVYLHLTPWRTDSVGPSGLRGSLPAAEKEVIALSSAIPGCPLLNVDGT